MLAAPKALHSHRLHLNKMRFVVTEGAGVHCVVDLGHFKEDAPILSFVSRVSWNDLLEASQRLHFGLTVQPLAPILSSLHVAPPSQPGVISHLYIMSLDMEVPQDMC